MEIKKIINLCKKSGQLRLYEGEGKQWISDGYALFPLFDLPYFDEANICKAYDISTKKAEKMHISCDLNLPTSYDYSDDAENEQQCERGAPLFGGLIPITTAHGLEFIQSKYLSPFSGSDDKMLYIFERTTSTGGSYFAIKDGFMLVGIVLPYDCINESFVNRVKTIYEQCEMALCNKKNNAEKEGTE